MEWLKRPARTDSAADPAMTSSVQNSLADIEQRGITAVRDHARRLDGWDGEFLLSPRQVKADIQFAHEQIARFAKAQRGRLGDFEIETLPYATLCFRGRPRSGVGSDR